jgi:hypothetical protein
MYIYYFLSCLLGIFIKIYDDFNDLKILRKSIILEISKIIITLCSFLLIQQSYILGLIVFVSLLISNSCKQFDRLFWYAYTYFIGFLCILYYYKFHTIFDNFIYKLFFIIFIPACIYIEETTFGEEISRNKMLSRSYGIVINSVLLLALEYHNAIKNYDLHFFAYLILFVNSYFLTNIVIQLIFVNNIKNNKKNNLKKKKRVKNIDKAKHKNEK